MTAPTPRAALYGNPPSETYEPRKSDIQAVLEQIETMAVAGSIKYFDDDLGDLPTSGNSTGDLAVVLDAGSAGGVYRWNGSSWVKRGPLPLVLTESLSAQQAADARDDAIEARDAAQSARDGAVAARTAAQTARTGAEAARDLAQSYRDQAKTYRDDSRTARDESRTYSVQANTHRTQAAQSATQAELAAIAAMVDIYPTVAAGLAAVSSGESFGVFAADSRLEIYTDNAGSAVLLGVIGEVVLPDALAVLADSRTYPTGTVMVARAEGYRYRASATGPISNAGGQKLTPLGQTISPRMFGARGDADEGAATAGAVGTNDAVAVQAAIRFAESIGAEVLLDGKFRVHAAEITIRKTILVRGLGAGSGYAEAALTDYAMTSGLIFTGTATPRIRTRIRHRAAAGDAQDAPLSVGLNIEAEYVKLRDFAAYLWFDRSDASPTNFGSDYDVGVFVGCRVHTSMDSVHILGYWREAGLWSDVTRGSALPQFLDEDGVAYDGGTVLNGADGLTLNKVFVRGARWGIRVQGAKPAAGYTAYGPAYYDEQLGAAVSDARGNFGHSDFTMVACSIYGPDHHSNRRWVDAGGDYLAEKGAGAMWIDGLAGNASGALQGMRFVSCRFATWNVFRVRLGRVNRPQFVGCHIETRSGSNRLSATGAALAFNGTDTYGMASMEAATQNAVFIGGSGGIATSTWAPFIDTSAGYSELLGAGASTATIPQVINADGFRSRSGELDLRSTAGSGVRVREGSTTVALFGPTDVEFRLPVKTETINALTSELDLRAAAGSVVRLRSGSSTAVTIGADGIHFGATVAAEVIAGTGELSLRAADGSGVRLRSGSSTKLVADANTIRPGSDNAQSAGTSGSRYTQLFAATATISTSDEREKQNIASIPDEVLDIWRTIEWQKFRFKDAVAEKGEDARIHVGLIAQRIMDAFGAAGYDPMAWGLLCYDEWFEEDADGNPTDVLRYRYGVRYEEALALESALLRRTQERLEARLAALEAAAG